MRLLTNISRWVRRLFNPDEKHLEIDEELEFHMEMKTQSLVDRGLEAAAARDLAARSFGSKLSIHEQGYDFRGSRFEDFWGDARFATRILRRKGSTTALIIAMLGLGIGVNTSMFSLVHAIVMQPLPFPGSNGLVVLHQSEKGKAGGVSYPHFLDWSAASQSLKEMAIYSATSSTMTGRGAASNIHGATVSASLFPLLQAKPLRGRVFQAKEDKRGGSEDGSRPVLISEYLWRHRFQSAENIVGEQLVLDAMPFRIAGVMPDSFQFPIQQDRLDFWTTVAVDAEPTLYGGSIPTSRGYPRYDAAIARLRPNSTLLQARSEMERIAQQIAQAHPGATSANDIRVSSALDDLVGYVRPVLLLLYGAVACVLLVASANAANLLLVRALDRGKEFALRTAVGARPLRLVRQLLVESLLLSGAGGVLGLTLGWAFLRIFLSIAPPETPRLASVHLDMPVLLFALGLSVATGVLFGILPALSATKVDVTGALKEGGRSVTSGGTAKRARALLVCFQVAVSLALTSSALLLTNSLIHTLRTEKGFDSTSILTASISLPIAQYPQRSERTLSFYRDLKRRLRLIPGVSTVAAAQTLPLSGQSNSTNIVVEGGGQADKLSADLRFVDPDYFQLLRIPLQQGRLFSERDDSSRPQCIVVNQAFVQSYLQSRNPLQVRVSLGWGGNGQKQIVGVVANIRHHDLALQATPEVYVPQAQFSLNDMSILVKTKGDPLSYAEGLRQQVQAIDSSIPLEQIRTLDEYENLSVLSRRFLAEIMGAFSLGTLLLAAAGLYGAISYSITSRLHEFGIRMALGSSSGHLLKLVFKHTFQLLTAGVLLGLALTLFTTHALSKWLYQVSPTDPLSLGVAVSLFILIAILATLTPAHEAISVSPIDSLREQ